MEEAPEGATEAAEQQDEGHEEQSENIKGDDSTKHETGSGRSSSSASTTEVQEEPERGMDEHKIHELTPSMTEILHDVESPAPSKPDLNVVVDTEDAMLKKALTSIKQNFNETKVTAELKKMYDLYQQSQMQNTILAGKCQKYLDKIDKYEARHIRDPRVTSALRMAEKHRNEKIKVSEEKRDLETELVEAQLETRHVEDAMKIKTREMVKLQDELKKLRDVEKQVEAYETQLILRESDIQHLQEKYEGDLEDAKAEGRREIDALLAKLAQEKEAKATSPEVETTSQRIEHNMKVNLVKDIAAKQRLLKTIDMDRKMTKKLLETSRTRVKQLSDKIRLLNINTMKIRREKRITDGELNKWLLKYTDVKNELENANDQLQKAGTVIFALRASSRRVTGANVSLNRLLQQLQKDLAATTLNFKRCTIQASKLDAEITRKERELIGTIQRLDAKHNQFEYLHHRFNILQRQKKEQGDLLRASQANTLVLIKEVTNLQNEIQSQERINQDLMESTTRLRTKLGSMKNHYMEALQNNRLLTRQKEMQEFFANEMEDRMTETETHMHALIRANIQLYCENTTQGEVAVLQSNQFKIKEKETQALDTLNQDKDETIGKLEERDRKKTTQIEQLTRELVEDKSHMNDFKTLVKNMTEEGEKMHLALIKAGTTEKRNVNAMELLRRQRDLFGSRLLQARTELSLAHKKESMAKMIMKKSSASHQNLQNDLTVLKLEIKNMRRKLKIYEGNDVIMESLRQDMASLTVALELEKAKCRALAESRQPIIHRWRALLAADPSKYELIMKVHKLTQRLIDKTTEVTEKEMIIHQKDRHFLQLQTLVARRSRPSLDREMEGAKSIIRKQQRQIKALTAEVNMSMHDLNRQSQVIQHKENETHEAQKKIIKQQRINRKLTDKLPPIQSGAARGRGGYYLQQA